jgi:hypothetical protein
MILPLGVLLMAHYSMVTSEQKRCARVENVEASYLKVQLHAQEGEN